ncbi:hypothetical protein LCGC14_0431370 [marine sediment metagenome]|uniref:Uncharacterized protein n=1 Tax=marine sediment metagenome TaxID=412755 RepID=A0A0F9T6B3_9ZZZZ
MTDIEEGIEKLMRKAVGSSWHTYQTEEIFAYLKSKGVVRLAVREKTVVMNDKGVFLNKSTTKDFTGGEITYYKVVNLDGTEL